MRTNRHIKILTHLRNIIEENKYRPGFRLPSESDLAREFGTGKMAAKIALDKLKAEGLVVRREGSGSYVSDGIFAPFRRVAILIPHLGSRFANEVCSAALEVFQREGIACHLIVTSRNVSREEKILSSLADEGFDGALFYPYDTEKIPVCLGGKDFPIVLLDRYFRELDADQVSSNHYDSCFRICKRFSELGHRNILFLTDPPMLSSVRHRISGFESVIRQNVVSAYKSGILLNPEDERKLDALLCEYLDAHPDTDAILTTGGSLEIHLLRTLKQRAIRIGTDVLLALYDPEPGAHEWDGLSHFQILQDTAGIGRTAACRLLERLRGNHEHRTILLPVEIRDAGFACLF